MRTAWNIGIVFSILYLPWWLSLVFIAAGCFFVRRFFESIFYGILIDALYGTKFGIYGFAYVFTVSAGLIFLLTHAIRRRVIW